VSTATSAASIRGHAIGAKQLRLRADLWPKLDPSRLWSPKTHKGFTTIPRTMPLILRCMDDMSKGTPVSTTYLDLWCRMFGESFVTLKADEMAYFAGFTGQRAVTTWRHRIKILKTLEFIDTAEGAAGDLSHAVLLNPYLIIKEHQKNGRASKSKG
jgi:hypothetical protein